MATKEVYVLGRIIVDLYGNEINASLEEVKSFNKYLGGSAGNTAVGLARHGADVGLISRVGADQHGDFLLDTLAREGVDTAMVRRDSAAPTGLAFAALRPPGDSEVLFYCNPCAYQNLCVADLDMKAIEQARVLVVCATTLSTSPSREATLVALKTNRASGGINVMDVDWRPMFWNNHEEAHFYYEMALGAVDVVIANESELAFLSRTSDPLEASRLVISLGPHELVAKRGGDGVMYFGAAAQTQVPAFHVNVLNTLGAGDGFGAAYTHGLLQGWDVGRRLSYATAAGAIVVSRHSCSEAMPTAAETDEFIATSVRG